MCFCRQRRADPGRVGQLIAAAGSTLFQLAQQLFGDGAEALLLQRAEDDELIQTAHQLRPEPLFRLGNGGFRLLFKGGFASRPEAQRCALPGEESCAEVGGQQDDGIAEIRLAAHGVGQLAVLEHLQEHILNIRVRLFDFVKEHHAVGAAADGLRELTALVVAQIARRRTQQTRHGVLLLILRHIELEQGFLAAEPAFRQRLCQRSLTDTGRPEEEHRADRPARLPQPGAAAPDGPGHGSDSPALAHDFGVQALFEAGQTFPLFFAHPFCRDAAGLRHHPGNFLPAEDGVFLPFPFGPDTHRRAGFVHEVDGLIRQTAPRQIPH